MEVGVGARCRSTVEGGVGVEQDELDAVADLGGLVEGDVVEAEDGEIRRTLLGASGRLRLASMP